MTKPITDETLQQLREEIDAMVVGGLKTEETIVASAIESLGWNYDETILTPQGEKFLAEALAAHRAGQASWPAVTDCDRLDAVYAELEQAGLICRQDLGCCGVCGDQMINQEMKAAIEAGKPLRGFSYFHSQDIKDAVAGKGLHLYFGSAADEREQCLEIAAEIVAAFERHGFDVYWSEEYEEKIEVEMTWQRRRRRGLTIVG